MRAFLAFSVLIFAAYWIDQTYGGGALSQICVGMFEAAVGR
jgi:hypothetical protein